MIAFILLAAQGGEGQVSQIARTFGVDWPHLGAQIISFTIVCAVLYKFAYKQILAMLEERRQQISQGIANAEMIKAELNRTEEQRREVMAKAYQQSAKAIEEARLAAARVLESETQKAIASAEQIIARARQAAAHDRDRMLAELKREVGGMVAHAAMAATGKILTPDDQKRLAAETVRQMTASV